MREESEHCAIMYCCKGMINKCQISKDSNDVWSHFERACCFALLCAYWNVLDPVNFSVDY